MERNDQIDRVARYGPIATIVIATVVVLGFMLDVKDDLREEIGGLRTEVREEIGGLRTEVREEIGGLRKEMRENIGGLRTEMRENIGGLRGEIGKLNDRFDRHLEYHLVTKTSPSENPAFGSGG